MVEQDFMLMLSEQNQIARVVDTNRYTERFGLSLSEQDAGMLVRERMRSLKEQQRVEFGKGILEKLIMAFCDSVYISQNDYAETIARLQDIFYLYKNESMDTWTDDELIAYMREAYDGECQGSLDYLEDTYLERFAREIRTGTKNWFGRCPEDED